MPSKIYIVLKEAPLILTVKYRLLSAGLQHNGAACLA